MVIQHQHQRWLMACCCCAEPTLLGKLRRPSSVLAAQSAELASVTAQERHGPGVDDRALPSHASSPRLAVS
jgi:hypothetical protein